MDNKELEKNKVGFAKSDDIPQIVSMAFKAYEEAEIDYLPKPILNDILEEVFDMVINHVVLVKRKDTHENSKEIEGVVCFRYGSPWWNKGEKALQQRFMYIHPEHRTPVSIKYFLEAVKEFSKDFEILPSFSVIGKNAEKFSKVLTRMGFEQIGSDHVYVKENLKG